MILAFEFDFNDLGMVDAELDIRVSTDKSPCGGSMVDFKVVGVELYSDDIKISQKTLLDICNDRTRAIHSAIESELNEKLASQVA